MMQYDYSATHDCWLRQAMFNKDKAKHLGEWRDRYEKKDAELTFDQFGFTPNLSDLDRLPHLSFMLRVPLKLRKPYLSKDDRAFHLLDNPVRKDRIFQTPMVASTSWKGALHSAMIQQLVEWWCNLDDKTSRTHRKELLARRISIARLFGTEKGIDIDDRKLESYLDSLGDDHLARWYRRYIRRHLSSSGFFSGRLYFYPTFFNQVGLEVINPHDRKKGTAKNPILIECVPIGATGELVILYVPFGKVKGSEVAADLKLVTAGVKDMLMVYGFGAKTSSGFGVAELNGQIEFGIRADWSCLEEISNQKLEFLNDDGTLKQEFLNADGSFKTEKQYKTFPQNQGRTHNKKFYQDAKRWWEANNNKPKLPDSFKRKKLISFESLMTTAEECCNQQIKGGIGDD
ncbi:RAMP superfamily CRISPR-associated protein [Trichothermofontia sp.]